MDCLAHWSLDRPPFGDGAVLPIAGRLPLLAKLRHGLAYGGTAALSGPEGTGKTVLARQLLEEFGAAGWGTAYLPRPLADPADWLARLDPDGAAAGGPNGGAGAFTRLESFLRNRLAAGGRLLAAVDDMQTAREPGPGDLLRALHNVTEGGQRALHLLLVGQPAWLDREGRGDGLASFFAVRASLPPLNPEECLFYLQARLARAGRGEGVITRRAALRLAAASRGRPRDLDRLMELALITGYGLGVRRITPDIADMAAADLGLPPGPAARPAFDPVDDESVEDRLPPGQDPDMGGPDAGPVDVLALLSASPD